MKWLKLAERKGHPLAIYNLGIIYAYGLFGIRKDIHKSEIYYKKAFTGLVAGRGEADARWLCDLGVCFFLGLGGVKNNKKMAMELFCESAERGYRRAETYLGHMFYNAQGVGKKLKMAKRWYGEAAKHHHKQAIAALSELKRSQRR